MGDKQQKILVIQTAFLGDVVLTSPLLTGVRRMFPRAHLSALVIPGNREILDGNSLLDEVLVYDKKSDRWSPRSFYRMAALLKERQFDFCLLPHRSFRSGLLAWAAGIPVRIGFKGAAGSWFYTQSVRRDEALHEVRRNLQLLSVFDNRTRQFSRDLWISIREADRQWAKRTLGEMGVGPADTLVAMAPGSVWNTKRWTPAGFSAVADHLIKESGFKVVFVGSRQDRPVVEDVLSSSTEKALDLTGRTSLQQLGAVLEQSRLLVTNDNGAMHVGVAQRVPVVAIFGSTTLSLGYGPFTENARVVETELQCRPCGKHGHRKCPLGHFDCMNRISPEAVLTAAESLLKKPEAGVGRK